MINRLTLYKNKKFDLTVEFYNNILPEIYNLKIGKYIFSIGYNYKLEILDIKLYKKTRHFGEIDNYYYLEIKNKYLKFFKLLLNELYRNYR